MIQYEPETARRKTMIQYEPETAREKFYPGGETAGTPKWSVDPQVVIHRWDETPAPVRIKLELHPKQNYTWEISYSGATVDATLAVLREANDKLQAEYGEAKQ